MIGSVGPERKWDEMLRSLIACAIVVFAVGAANATTVTGVASFEGDVCAFDPSGGNDCLNIEQPDTANDVGVFTLGITGLNSQISGPATISITSTNADLFLTGGGNNIRERFELLIDDVSFGVLFDGSTADEAAINPGLALSVQQAIDNSSTSADSLFLSLQLSNAEIAPLLDDGELEFTFDFRVDVDVGSFTNIGITAVYAVPLPSSMVLMFSGFAGFIYLGRRRRLNMRAPQIS